MKYALVLLSLLASAMVNAEKLAIVGGQVHTMGEMGVLEQGTVLINNGQIEAVSQSTDIPSGYQRIDASGKVVTPGLIGAMTSLGLVEVSMSAGPVHSSVDDHAVSKTGAALDVSYAINTDATVVGVSRLEGVTSAATAIQSSGQLFHGQGAVISLDPNGDPILAPNAFMVLKVTGAAAQANGGSKAALWVAIETAFNEAKEAAIKGQSPMFRYADSWHGITSKADVKVLQEVLKGAMPLFIYADSAADIRQVIRFKARNEGLKVTLVGGVEAWRVAEELVAANISVVLDPESNLPGNFEQLGATLRNAAKLESAGGKVAIGMNTHNIRLATQHAGNAVSHGLSHEQGLAALTINPATMLGVDGKLGSLEAGKQADVVIWSGDPLEVTESAEQVIINGKMIEMTSRQDKLMKRYKAFYGANGTTPHYIR
ncbi:amidohydrolase [Alteromonas sediminis]|uniref:Amidohydrolase n=1 Tax=Alteromonas sediminis TaxID=2259342 RepID=A0A3N5ZE94_9ALTE|nr:amidohydrolase family protein [Alteromonas sediminis]RPJ68648.1 amidohydrolase [Alteromonas sediminis]